MDVSYSRAGLDRRRRCRSASRPSASSAGTRSGSSSNTRPGVDLLRLRDPRCGGNGGADLPDELARGVPLRARPLGGDRGDRRGRGAAREDPQDPRRPAAPRARDLDGEARRRRRDQLRRAAREGPLRVRRGLQEPHRIGGGVGRRHLHLHLRHDRPSEGLHHRPPELARHARHGRGAERARGAGGRLSVPAAGARVRAADPARLDRRRRDDRLLGARPGEDHPQPDGGQADLLPVRPAHVREDLLDGRLGGAGQGAARAGDPARHEGARDAGAAARRSRPSCRRPSTRPTRRCSRTSATCSAGGSSRPSPARPRSPRRSSSSSTPAACWCSRAGA